MWLRLRFEQVARSGGEELDAFAEVAGMSVEQFAKAYRDGAAGAVASFVYGLGGIQATGGDVFATLEDLELGESRVRDALPRAAHAGDLFRESLALGSTSTPDPRAARRIAHLRGGLPPRRARAAHVPRVVPRPTGLATRPRPAGRQTSDLTRQHRKIRRRWSTSRNASPASDGQYGPLSDGSGGEPSSSHLASNRA